MQFNFGKSALFKRKEDTKGPKVLENFFYTPAAVGKLFSEHILTFHSGETFRHMYVILEV